MRLGAETLDDGGLDLTGAVALGLERYADAEAVVAIAADLPFVTARGRARAARARASARRRGGAGRHDERRGGAPALGAPRRATARAAPRATAGCRCACRGSRRISTRPPTSPPGAPRCARNAARRRCREARASRAGSSPPSMPASVTIIGNVGDDVELLGLHVSPDLDTVLYTLCGRIDPGQRLGCRRRHPRGADRRGRARRGRLVHPRRPRHRAAPRAQRAPAGGRAALGDHGRSRDAGSASRSRLLPATDDRLRTLHRDGSRRARLPAVARRPPRRRSGALRALRRACPHDRRRACSTAIREADVLVLAPSNPFVSLDPILAVDGVRDALVARRERVVAISPIIAGSAVKGPLAGMLETLGPAPGARRGGAAAGAARGGVRARRGRSRARARGRGARAARGRGAVADARSRDEPAPRAGRARRRRRMTLARGRRRRGDRRAARRRRSRARCSPTRSSAQGSPLADGDVLCIAQKAVSKVEGRELELVVDRAVGARTGDRGRRGRSRASSSSCCASRGRSSAVAARSSSARRTTDTSARRPASIARTPPGPTGRSSCRSIRTPPPRRLRAALARRADVAIVITDSFGRPFRRGTTGVALGVAGLAPVVRLAGTLDSAGRRLENTEVHVADAIASTAELVLGQVGGVPAVLLRGLAFAARRRGRGRRPDPGRSRPLPR